MNETQKTLMIIGLSLILLGIAQQFLFVQPLKNSLIAEEVDYQLAEFSEETPNDEADAEASTEDQIINVQQKLLYARILKYIFWIFSVAFIVAAYVLRIKKEDIDEMNEWGDNWEDEEGEEDEWEDDD